MAGLLDVAGKLVERLLPERSVSRQEGLGVREGLGLEMAVVVPALALAPQQSGALEHTEVLGNGRQSHSERLGKLADGGGPARQTKENAPPRSIPKGGEQGVELVLASKLGAS